MENAVIVKHKSKSPDYIKTYNQQYYQQNKESIKNMVNQKVQCGCGKSISKSNLSKHLKNHKVLKEI